MTVDVLAERHDPKTGRTFPPIIDYLDVADCWEWTKYRDKDGYGRVTIDKRQRPAHRVVYESLVGPIPEGMEIDHLCRNTACCNPDHLEVVTSSVNQQRRFQANRAACPKGHIEFRYAGGTRHCRACDRERK